MSTFGTLFRVTTFGESHCRGVGCVVDGVPPGLELAEADLQPQLDRRRPGQSRLTTPRSETDRVTILSGTERGRALGTPVGLFVPNENVRPGDYSEMAAVPRPGHADYTYQAKYGLGASSGGGRSSARETIGRVAAGAIAEKWLRREWGTEIVTFVSSVGAVSLPHALCLRNPRSGRPWTRAEVDRLGTLTILRDVAAGWRLLPVPPAGAVASTTLAADTATVAVEPLFVLPGGGAAASVAAASAQAGEHRERIRREQAVLDTLDDDAFVAAGAAQTSASGPSPGPPCYEDSDGLVYDRHGTLLPGTAAAPESRSNDVIVLRCPDPSTSARMATAIREVKAAQDSTGGCLTTVVTRVPVGLGEPCFDKLEAKLAHAMLSLPATKAFEIGSGFEGTKLRGSEHNDLFTGAAVGVAGADGPVLLRTATNNAGGTLGGISSGADLVFRVAIKPVSTISRAQCTAGYDGKPTVLEAKGRHDPCVLPRAPPLVEGMCALVLADAALMQRSRGMPILALPEELEDEGAAF